MGFRLIVKSVIKRKLMLIIKQKMVWLLKFTVLKEEIQNQENIQCQHTQNEN